MHLLESVRVVLTNVWRSYLICRYVSPRDAYWVCRLGSVYGWAMVMVNNLAAMERCRMSDEDHI